MPDRVHIAGIPTADQALALHREVFPEPGTYEIEHLANAAMAQPALAEDFEAWFVRHLVEESRTSFATAQEAMWRTLDQFLQDHGVQAPSQAS